MSDEEMEQSFDPTIFYNSCHSFTTSLGVDGCLTLNTVSRCKPHLLKLFIIFIFLISLSARKSIWPTNFLVLFYSQIELFPQTIIQLPIGLSINQSIYLSQGYLNLTIFKFHLIK
jgi:hypothetical protein